MTTAYTLTESWQEIASGSGMKFATFVGDGPAYVATGSSAPASDASHFHAINDGGSFGTTANTKLYARLESVDGPMTASVEVDANPATFGYGLTAISVAPTFVFSRGR